MTRTLVVGVDPGATTGICALPYLGCGAGPLVPIVLQCDGASAVDLVGNILTEHAEQYRLVVAIEQFVVGPRAAKSATAAAGRMTRELISQLGYLAEELHVHPAVTVKRWATDKRLHAAGLYAPTRGRPHARDAARHALYTAVRSGVTRDPLSTAAV